MFLIQYIFYIVKLDRVDVLWYGSRIHFLGSIFRADTTFVAT